MHPWTQEMQNIVPKKSFPQNKFIKYLIFFGIDKHELPGRSGHGRGNHAGVAARRPHPVGTRAAATPSS